MITYFNPYRKINDFPIKNSTIDQLERKFYSTDQEIQHFIQKRKNALFFPNLRYGKKIKDRRILRMNIGQELIDLTVSGQKINIEILRLIKNTFMDSVQALKKIDAKNKNLDSLEIYNRGLNTLPSILNSSLIHGFLNPNKYPPNVNLTLELRDASYNVKGMGQYNDGTLIGAGSFGRVFIGEEQGTGKRVAIKVAKPPSHKKKEHLENEAVLLKKVYGLPNVVGAFHAEILESDGEAVMVAVMPQLEGVEDLFNVYRELNIREKYAALIDGARALLRCHENGIIHRDVKPENFLYQRRKEGNCLYLIDFGLASEYGIDHPDVVTFSGTAQYMAPEVINGERQTDKTDVYSFALMMYAIFTGRILDCWDNNVNVIYHERKLRNGLFWEDVEELEKRGVHVNVAKMISDCVKFDPNGRPTMDEVLRTLEEVRKYTEWRM